VVLFFFFFFFGLFLLWYIYILYRKQTNHVLFSIKSIIVKFYTWDRTGNTAARTSDALSTLNTVRRTDFNSTAYGRILFEAVSTKNFRNCKSSILLRLNSIFELARRRNVSIFRWPQNSADKHIAYRTENIDFKKSRQFFVPVCIGDGCSE